VLEVEQVLVVGVGVDGRHQPRFVTPKASSRTFTHRHEAVRRARGIGDDVVLSRVVGVFVDAITNVASTSVAGAEMMTFFAPALRCWPALSRVVNRPVDSMTTSTFSSPQGSSAGLRSASTLMVLDRRSCRRW